MLTGSTSKYVKSLKNIGKKMRRKYTLNERVFDDLSEPNACYWLGVITADGWVSGNQIGLEISVRDYEWLEEFKSFLQYGGDIHVYPPSKSGRGGGERCRIVIYSSHVVGRLNDLGINNKKTLNVTFCSDMPESNLRHYVRGLTDGDGHIIKKSKHDHVEWGLTGTKMLLDGTKDYLSSQLPDISLSLSLKEGKTYRLSTSSNYACWCVVRLLYLGNNVCLKRKGDMAEVISRQVCSCQRYFSYRHISNTDLLEMKDSLGSWGKVAKHLECGKAHLYKMRRSREMLTENSCKFVSQNTSIEQIYELYNKHKNWELVAEELHISSRQLRRIKKTPK